MARNCGSIYVFSPHAYQNRHSVIEGFIVPADCTNLELQYSGFDRSAQNDEDIESNDHFLLSGSNMKLERQ